MSETRTPSACPSGTFRRAQPRAILAIWLIVLLCAFAPNAVAQLLLHVEIMDVRGTDLTLDCAGEDDVVERADGSVCIPHNVWYVYEARVKDVLLGAYPEQRIVFGMYAHGSHHADTFRDVVVAVESLLNAETARELGTRHYVRHLNRPRNLCLDAQFADALARGGDVHEIAVPRTAALDPAKLRCFEMPLRSEDAVHCVEEASDSAESELAASLACMRRAVEQARAMLDRREARVRAETASKDKAQRAALVAAAARFRDYLRAVCARDALQSDADDSPALARLRCEHHLLLQRLRTLAWLHAE